MGDQHSVATRARPALVWPPDDTEESVLGTNLHQATIHNLRLGLNEVAATLTSPGEAPPWEALSQTLIMGLQRSDGSRYRVLPDVYVYRQPIDILRASLSLAADGPPVLIIEVASDETYQSDLDVAKGKPYSYAQAGVQEYLVLDPTGIFVPERGRGWRLEDGAYHPWPAEVTGHWRSREIAAAVGLEGLLATVYAADGRRLLREGEIERELSARDRRIRELTQRDRRWDEERARLEREQTEELARKDAELADLRRRLEQLETEE